MLLLILYYVNLRGDVVPTNLENKKLVGIRENGKICYDEAEIVELRSSDRIAEKYGIPFVFLNLVTQFIPSSNYPPTVIPWQNLPKWVNRLLWHIVNSLINLSLVGILNEQRKKLGLKPIKDIYDHMLGSLKTCIIAVNEALDKVPDYKFNYIQTGLWHVP